MSGSGAPWLESKLVDPSQLEEWALLQKQRGETIVTLNGSFDLLHGGHLAILYEAAQQGSCLLVALNSDQSIQTYKSPRRPILPLRARLELIAALSWVDYVTFFEETTPLRLLEKVCPAVHVNGAEYGEECIEAPVVKKGGGRLHLYARIPGLSTTALLEKIYQAMEGEERGGSFVQ